MSVFTSRVTKTIDIPNEPGQTAVIRKLAPRHLDAAAKASQKAAFDMLTTMTGGPVSLKDIPGVLKEMKGFNAGELDKQKLADPLLQYDRLILLERGIQSWTFDVPAKRESYEDLDDDTQDAVAREILRLAKPSLFQTTEESEADRKNG